MIAIRIDNEMQWSYASTSSGIAERQGDAGGVRRLFLFWDQLFCPASKSPRILDLSTPELPVYLYLR